MRHSHSSSLTTREKPSVTVPRWAPESTPSSGRKDSNKSQLTGNLPFPGRSRSRYKPDTGSYYRDYPSEATSVELYWHSVTSRRHPRT
eukprot:1734405-Rhodomonas_salina.1